MFQLLTVSGTLAGLCITGVTVFKTLGKEALSSTIADDVRVFSALFFLLCSYAIFWALRVRTGSIRYWLTVWADGLFLVGLTGMVATGFLMVFTVL